jgi:uncharacterized protein YhhL (DUF1145 family)
MPKNSVLIKNLPFYINPKDCCKKDCCKKDCCKKDCCKKDCCKKDCCKKDCCKKDCCKKDCCKKECQEIINKYLDMITTIQIPTINFDKIHTPKIPINLDGFIKPKPPQIPTTINNDCLCELYKETYKLYLQSIDDINSKITGIYNRELDIETIVLLNSIGMVWISYIVNLYNYIYILLCITNAICASLALQVHGCDIALLEPTQQKFKAMLYPNIKELTSKIRCSLIDFIDYCKKHINTSTIKDFLNKNNSSKNLFDNLLIILLNYINTD